jgi:hypothetical protein
MLLLLGTAGVVALALAVALWAATRRNGAVLRRSLLVAGGVAAIYALFWLGGLVATRGTVLPPGQEISFCGLDCHLHVSVADARAAGDLRVTVRLSSNAVRAPEWPGALRFRLRDAAGAEYAPANPVSSEPLLAGQVRTEELRFPGGGGPQGAELIVTWGGWLDYLVPGAGNPLVQRRRRLALPAAPGRGA